MKIKVCGTRDRENLQHIIGLKPDFIGFVFYEKSPRYVTEVPKILLPPEIKTVGVFVNAAMAEMLQKAKDFGLDYIQLHGQESVEICQQIKSTGLGVIKAFNMSDNFDFSILQPYKKAVDYFLFDASAGTLPGGTGETFNWDTLRAYDQQIPFFLSGGIGPLHAEVLRSDWMQQFSPFALDVNSRFELTPGVKNIEVLSKFIDEIRKQDKIKHEVSG